MTDKTTCTITGGVRRECWCENCMGNIPTEPQGDRARNGHGNVAIGFGAGLQITSGDSNICVGQNAGRNITTESRCICIGDDTEIIAGDDDQLIIREPVNLNVKNFSGMTDKEPLGMCITKIREKVAPRVEKPTCPKCGGERWTVHGCAGHSWADGGECGNRVDPYIPPMD